MTTADICSTSQEKRGFEKIPENIHAILSLPNITRVRMVGTVIEKNWTKELSMEPSVEMAL